MKILKRLKNRYVTVVLNYSSDGDEESNDAMYGKLIEANGAGLLLEDGGSKSIRWVNLNIVDFIYEGEHLDTMRVEVPK